MFLINCTSMRFNVSLKIYLHFFNAIIDGFHCNHQIYHEEGVKIVCERIEMLFYKNKSYSSSNIEENIFYICSIFTNVINRGNNPLYIQEITAARKETLDIINSLCNKFVS